MSERVPTLGIDFGTTNSSIAWYNPRTGEAEVILNAEGQPKTPSLVHFSENEILIGDPVLAMLQDASTNRTRREDIFARTVTSIKRNLLSPPRIALPGGRYVKPVEVVAEILKKLKRDAEEGHFHEKVQRAVITCPAEFNVLQRQKIEEAGILAGFAEVALLEEPVAGALAYARAGLKVGRHVLVYDLGGGTFDLAVLDNEEDSFYVAMEPKGVERCGGDDFDAALYHHCDIVSRENLGRPISLTGAVDLGFLQACRRRKESLTFQERGRFNNYLSSENGPVLFEHEVDRSTFEELIGGYVETTARLTEEILKQADSSGHEVDTVVLVGGSVRVPLVVKTLQETLPTSPLGFDKRDVAIALGAAHFTNVRWAPERKTTKAHSETVVMDRVTHLDRYRAAVEQTFVGGKLNKLEADRLNALARQLGLDKEGIVEVERRIMGNTKEGVLFQQYRRAVETVWSDGKVDTMEAEWLDSLANDLGLTRAQTSYAENKIMGSTKEDIPRHVPEASGPTEALGLVDVFLGHAEEVNAVAFGPDGDLLLSGASDHDIRGWNLDTGHMAGTLAGHTGRVSSVAFDPGGRFLASGGSDKTARVWKLPGGEPFHAFNHADWVFCVAFAPGGRLITGGADGEIGMWSLEGRGRVGTFEGHAHWVLSLAVGHGLVISGGADDTLRVWDLEGGKLLHVLQCPDWVRAVALAPNGRFVASGCDDGMIRVWDPRKGVLLREISGHSGPVRSVAVSPDGRTLYSGGADGGIKAWNPLTGVPTHVLTGNFGGVGSVAVSPGGELVAGGYDDGTVRVWRKGVVGEGRQVRNMPPDLPD